MSLCPEAAACIGVLERGLAEGHIRASERVVIFNTGAVQKYAELFDAGLATVDADEPDFGLIGG